MKLFSDIELMSLIKRFKGRESLIASHLDMTISDLLEMLSGSPWALIEMDNQSAHNDQVVKDIADMQMKFAAISGKQWAIAGVKAESTGLKSILRRASNCLNEVSIKTKSHSGYHPSFDTLAYKVLSCTPFATASHLYRALHCDRNKIKKWITEHDSFADSISMGISESEALSRDMLLTISLSPGSLFNSSLLTALADNVYGIKDSSSEVQINLDSKGNSKSAEEVMKERGIPLPGVEVPDLGEDMGDIYLPESTKEEEKSEKKIDPEQLLKSLENLKGEVTVQNLFQRNAEEDKKIKYDNTDDMMGASPFGDK